MISEKTFSRGYSSFWAQNTPWLIDYVSFLNKGSIERKFKPLDSQDETKHRSINNTAAFLNFKQKNLGNDLELSEVLNITSDYIKHFPRNGLDTYTLNEINRSIINEQTKRLEQIYIGKSLIFDPQFKGCGIVSNCQGDLYYEDTICEIKAGERNLQSSDVKQLLVYCALNWLSEEKLKIDKIEIFNPRQGIFWSTKLKDLMDDISTLSMEDLFEEIGHFLYISSEEIEI